MRASHWIPTVSFLAAVALGPAAPVAASGTPILPGAARNLIGKHTVVEGPVAAVEQNGDIVRLRLGTSPHELWVSLVPGMLSKFPSAPAAFYRNKIVRVTGTVRSFRGTPELLVRNPADIQVISDTAGPAVNATTSPVTGTAPSVSVQQRLEKLDARVRRLEERVGQLERMQPTPRQENP